MYKAVIMGAALDTGNRGVSALSSSIIKLILQVHPDADISLFIGNKSSAPQMLNAPSGKIQLNIVNHRLSPKSELKRHLLWIFFIACLQKIIPVYSVKMRLIRSNPVLSHLWDADFIGDIHGGDSFSDIYGQIRYISGILPLLVVLLLGKKLILLPQTYGPYKSFMSRKIAKLILKKAYHIISRDKEGLEVVKQIVGKGDGNITVKFCPDVAFVLDAAKSDNVEINPPLPQQKSFSLIGFNVNGLLYNGGYTRDNMFGLKYDYKLFARNLILALATDPSNHILLIPHTFGPAGNINSDPDASRDIIDQLDASYKDRVHIVVGEHDQFAIKGIIGLADFFIGSRMHACIAALSQGIPTIGVAYSRKFVGVFESVGAGNLVADARTLDANETIKKILSVYNNRCEIKMRLQSIDQAQNEIKYIFQNILKF